MLTDVEAIKLVRSVFTDSRVEGPVEYRGLYLFQVFGTDPLEGDQDPFFSVDKETGELRDFSVITDGDPKEIESKFLSFQKSKG